MNEEGTHAVSRTPIQPFIFSPPITRTRSRVHRKEVAPPISMVIPEISALSPARNTRLASKRTQKQKEYVDPGVAVTSFLFTPTTYYHFYRCCQFCELFMLHSNSSVNTDIHTCMYVCLYIHLQEFAPPVHHTFFPAKTLFCSKVLLHYNIYIHNVHTITL